jgi:hypothetical protein
MPPMLLGAVGAVDGVAVSRRRRIGVPQGRSAVGECGEFDGRCAPDLRRS